MSDCLILEDALETLVRSCKLNESESAHCRTVLGMIYAPTKEELSEQDYSSVYELLVKHDQELLSHGIDISQIPADRPQSDAFEDEDVCEEENKPEILIDPNDMQLDEHVERAIAALARWNNPSRVFQIGGTMSEVGRDRARSYKIVRMELPVLKHRLAEAAIWKSIKPNRDGKPTYKKIYPNDDVVKAVLKDSTSWENVPYLKALTNTPIPREDGTISTTYGYDPATEYYYTEGLKLPAIPEHPTKSDAENAGRYLLTELFQDFPFKDDASKANMLGSLLGVVYRPLYDVSPLYVVTKPQAGEGSSLLVDIVALVCTGEDAPASDPNCKDNEEIRKNITSMLREGVIVVKLDNLDQNSMFDAPAWAKLLTEGRHQDRLLSQNKNLTLDNTLCLFLTGRSVKIGGDIPRRTVLIEMNEIDPELIRHPEKREFRHPNIKSWIKEHRGELVAAIFTMYRAWVLAGKPKSEVSVMGSFEGWSEVVGGVLEYAGVRGFLGNRNKICSEMDSENDEWAVFVKKWHEIASGTHLTAAEVLMRINAKPNGLFAVIPSCIEDVVKEGKSKALASKLSSYVNVPFDDLIIRSGVDKHSHTKQYWVEAVDFSEGK